MMKSLEFTKMSGTGNDFIMIDNRERLFSGAEHKFFKTICKRRTSIGADGVILVQHGNNTPVEMVYMNSDGRKAAMCGNGARCAARFAFDLGMAQSTEFDLEVYGSIYPASVKDAGVSIQFNSVVYAAPDLNISLKPAWKAGGLVQVGVPHYMVFVDSLESVPVAEYGARYRNDRAFPDGANINFVEIRGEDAISVRTYERGVEGETLSCGTGSIAASCASCRLMGVHTPVRVTTRGGILTVDAPEDWTSAVLTGPAVTVYKGVFADLP